MTRKTPSPDYPSLAALVVKASAVEASGIGADCKLSPGLHVVATPIGHRGDITLRALVTLTRCDAIACEDTRTSGALLIAYGIHRPLIAFHAHNEAQRQDGLIARMQAGAAIGLVSDAGMPVISDPGFALIRACRESNVPVTVLPGANAAITALAGCGLPGTPFLFMGFLPPKPVARRTALAALRTVAATCVFYEAPQRLAATLDDMAATLGTRPAVVARELTKLHEEMRPGPLPELAAHYADHAPRGEIVIVVGPPAAAHEPVADLDALLREALTRLSLRDAVAEVAAVSGIARKEVYARALDLTKGAP